MPVVRQPPEDRSSDPSINHGTRYAFDKRGCRCEACTHAHREYRALRRRALATTPSDLIPHGLLGYSNYMCRCEVCIAASAEWRATNHQARLRQAKRRNATSLDSARKHGQQWTGAEMEIASRRDLTDIEVGRMLGRTVSAVMTMRFKIRHDPKYQRVVGSQS